MSQSLNGHVPFVSLLRRREGWRPCHAVWTFVRHMIFCRQSLWCLVVPYGGAECICEHGVNYLLFLYDVYSFCLQCWIPWRYALMNEPWIDVDLMSRRRINVDSMLIKRSLPAGKGIIIIAKHIVLNMHWKKLVNLTNSWSVCFQNACFLRQND